VGVGTVNGELLRVRDEQGRSDYVKMIKATWLSPGSTKLCSRVFTSTEGFYLAMSGTDTMEVLYQRGWLLFPAVKRQPE
jgi:hypothetical protein